MNRVVNIFGLIAGICIVIGSVLWTNHVPGGVIFLMLGISLFALPFLPLYLIKLYLETRSLLHFILGFTALSIFSIGFLFRLLHFPGGELMVNVGFFLSLIYFITLTIVTRLKKPEKRQYKTSTLFIFCIIISLVYIGTKSSTDNIINSFVRFEQSFEGINENLSTSSEVVYDELIAWNETDTLNGGALMAKVDLIVNETVEICSYIDELRSLMIFHSGGEGTDARTIIKKDDLNVSNEFMLHHGNATILRDKMDAYRKNIISVLDQKIDVELIHAIDSIINFYEFEDIDWEHLNFEFMPVITSIARLSSIKSDILLLEKDLLNHFKRISVE